MRSDFFPVALAYISAFLAAWLCVTLLNMAILWETLIADIAATIVIFIFSRRYKNSSFYDAYWSIAPAVIALYWLLQGGDGVNMLRGVILFALVLWWSVRLTSNWAIHWEGLSHEDWRYQPMRDKAGKSEALADFFGIHFFPTMVVFIGLLPVYAALNLGSGGLNILDYIAIAVTAGAIIIETIADIQLHRFIATKRAGEFIETGLWRYSRHPNYFGEFGFWTGLMLFGLAAWPQGWWWIIAGSLVMALMFAFASIPMMDERSAKSREGYDGYMKRVSPMIPWFRKSG